MRIVVIVVLVVGATAVVRVALGASVVSPFIGRKVLCHGPCPLR